MSPQSGDSPAPFCIPSQQCQCSSSSDAPAPPLGNPMSEQGILAFLRLLLVIVWMDPWAGSSYSMCQARIVVLGEIPGDKAWDCLGKHSWDLLWSRVSGGLSPCSSGGAGGRSRHSVPEVLLLLPACSLGCRALWEA